DPTGFLSVIITKEHKQYDELLKIPIDSVVAIEGTKKEDTCFAQTIYFPFVSQKTPIEQIHITIKNKEDGLHIIHNNKIYIIPSKQSSTTPLEPYTNNNNISPQWITDTIFAYWRELNDALSPQTILQL